MKYYCINCNKPITRKSILGRCKSCAQAGELSSNWITDRTKFKYGKEFNKILREQIRKRDNYICQLCHITQKKLKRKLDIHHIDCDKKIIIQII